MAGPLSAKIYPETDPCGVLFSTTEKSERSPGEIGDFRPKSGIPTRRRVCFSEEAEESIADESLFVRRGMAVSRTMRRNAAVLRFFQASPDGAPAFVQFP
ncbi:MAG: hypothetical protein J6Z50_06475, partial [Fibrobacterales bacterium]|nr:hypothetical protein [Fibrobacterales bacterium]